MFLRSMLAAAAAALLLLPGTALAAGNIPEIHDEPFADVDARTETVAPTAAQRAAVAALGATATWTRFGTPKTLVEHGGFLAVGVDGARGPSTPRGRGSTPTARSSASTRSSR